MHARALYRGSYLLVISCLTSCRQDDVPSSSTRTASASGIEVFEKIIEKGCRESRGPESEKCLRALATAVEKTIDRLLDISEKPEIIALQKDNNIHHEKLNLDGHSYKDLLKFKDSKYRCSFKSSPPDLNLTDDWLSPDWLINRAFFFIGANTHAEALKFTVNNGGIDLVWDLWNKQFSGFYYHGVSLNTAVQTAGLSAGIYTGYGFGRQRSVYDAWSGYFVPYGASVPLPMAKFISGEFSAFVSGSNVSGVVKPADPFRDGTIFGASGGVSAGFSLPSSFFSKSVLPVTVNKTIAEWQPWLNANTLQFEKDRNLKFSVTRVTRGAVDYLKYDSVLGFTGSLLATLGPLAAPVIGHALIVAAWKQSYEWTPEFLRLDADDELTKDEQLERIMIKNAGKVCW